MTTTDRELIENLISLLKRHGYIGFVGTFIAGGAGLTFNCATVRLVCPGYDETTFKEIERRLLDIVDTAFNATQISREQGYTIDPDVLE